MDARLLCGTGFFFLFSAALRCDGLSRFRASFVDRCECRWDEGVAVVGFAEIVEIRRAVVFYFIHFSSHGYVK